MQKNKILITGSTGFVGKQVVKYLSALDVEIHLIVREGAEIPFDNIQSSSVSKNIFTESPDWWAEKCKNIDTIIHLAWYAEPGKYLDSPINEQCYTGTTYMAQGAVNAGVKRFVGIGTCFEYQFSESPLDVLSPLNPQTPYAEAKVKTFNYLSDFLAKHDVEFLWCRLFYLFGEGEDERRLIPFLRKSLAAGKEIELTSGEKVKDYLEIQEAGKIIANLAINIHTGPYNICSGKGITIQSLAENIADEYNRRDLLKFGRLERTSYDPPYIVGKKTDNNF
jgi:nucleoside-diphosphate-sugar epimerase